MLIATVELRWSWRRCTVGTSLASLFEFFQKEPNIQHGFLTFRIFFVQLSGTFWEPRKGNTSGNKPEY
jgi:hypothetical protein